MNCENSLTERASGAAASVVIDRKNQWYYAPILRVGTLYPMYLYDAPTASHWRDGRRNEPQSLVQSVTVAGLNFGMGDFTSSIGTGGIGSAQTCETTQWTSGTQLRCWARADREAGSILTITVSALAGTSSAVFTFDSPVVSETRLANIGVGGGSATVLGLGFGYTEQTASVAVSLVHCRTTSWSTSTSVKCAMDTSDPAFDSAMITVGAHAGTNLVILSFDAPVASYERFNLPNTAAKHLSVTAFDLCLSDQSA
jgi:hypothetical protein